MPSIALKLLIFQANIFVLYIYKIDAEETGLWMTLSF